MNARERIVYDRYESLGYDCIKQGIPDLVLLKNGKIEFVEVKSPTGVLIGSQERAVRLLRKHGFSVKVERVTETERREALSPPIFTEEERIEVEKWVKRRETSIRQKPHRAHDSIPA